MGRIAVLLSLLLLLPCCGGRASTDPPGDKSPSNSPSNTPSNSPITPLGGMPGNASSASPLLPPESGASFFWNAGAGHILLGNWFVSSSDGRTADAVVEGIDSSDPATGKACHVSGGQGIGVDLFAQLDHPSGSPVDLSAYSGISFRARLNAPRTALIVAFDAQGQFLSNPTAFPQRALTVTQEWQQFELPFNEFKLNTGAISSIDFVVDQGAEPVDLWVADLGLVCVGTCP
ncbi:MAG: hypothetical protein ABI548_11030 [Polyangiaceae bacterium]